MSLFLAQVKDIRRRERRRKKERKVRRWKGKVVRHPAKGVTEYPYGRGGRVKRPKERKQRSRRQ